MNPEPDERWNPAQPRVLPRPTYWPAALALGLTLALWGLLTLWVVSAAGLALCAASLLGWIGDLRRAHRDEEEA